MKYKILSKEVIRVGDEESRKASTQMPKRHFCLAETVGVNFCALSIIRALRKVGFQNGHY